MAEQQQRFQRSARSFAWSPSPSVELVVEQQHLATASPSASSSQPLLITTHDDSGVPSIADVPGEQEAIDLPVEHPRQDPAIRYAISQTLIGEYMDKYPQRADKTGFSRRSKVRYVWAHPFTNMVLWSLVDPTTYGKPHETKPKCAYIMAVEPCVSYSSEGEGRPKKSGFIITTASTKMKLVPANGRHELWISALEFILSGKQTIPGLMSIQTNYHELGPNYTQVETLAPINVSASTLQPPQRSEMRPTPTSIQPSQPPDSQVTARLLQIRPLADTGSIRPDYNSNHGILFAPQPRSFRAVHPSNYQWPGTSSSEPFPGDTRGQASSSSTQEGSVVVQQASWSFADSRDPPSRNRDGRMCHDEHRLPLELQDQEERPHFEQPYLRLVSETDLTWQQSSEEEWPHSVPSPPPRSDDETGTISSGYTTTDSAGPVQSFAQDR
ncbi:hypothetical protein HGRIS_003143 [Hohenbuehelia grisea]|uniref:Pleckstrin homology domain-containing protein n=1 Tax=Hohenbuehelia grisea TaxID=104357 RepID=A0ABR3JNU3_9AGAR